jgi:hypothetical protein
MERNHPSDVTDRQWHIIRGLLPKPASRGRKPLDHIWVCDIS